MDDFLQKVVIDPFKIIVDRVMNFLPNVLGFLLIIILGILIGITVKSFFFRLFRRLGIDSYAVKWGITPLFQKAHLKDPVSLVLSKSLSWITIIIFVITALYSLRISAVEFALNKLVLYLPNAIVSVVIIFLGYCLANFISRAVLIASVNAGLRMSSTLSRLVKFGIVLIAVSMSLEQLGIGKETIIAAFTLIFGGVILALAISFGLGGKEFAREYIAKKFMGSDEEEREDEIGHL
jgi:hypothetical protein